MTPVQPPRTLEIDFAAQNSVPGATLLATKCRVDGRALALASGRVLPVRSCSATMYRVDGHLTVQVSFNLDGNSHSCYDVRPIATGDGLQMLCGGQTLPDTFPDLQYDITELTDTVGRLEGQLDSTPLECRGHAIDNFLVARHGQVELRGTPQRDCIVGNRENNEIYGLGGNDIIFADYGHDVIRGGGGDDIIHGGHGDDEILAGDGKDTVFGGFGRDTIDGEGGADRLHGDGDDDRVIGGAGADVIDGGYGNDLLRGGDGNDRLLGGYGDDVIHGNAGTDTVDGGYGNDRCTGESRALCES